MTDELQKLKKALHDHAPTPDAEARKRALSAAMSAFDAENAHAAQGSRAGERQTRRVQALLKTLFGRRSMTFAQPKLRHILAGGASVAVLALVFVTATQLRLEAPSLLGDRAQPVAPSEKPKVALVEARKREADQATLDDVVGREPSAEVAAGRLEYERADAPAMQALSEAAPAGPPASAVGALSMESVADAPMVEYYEDQGRDRFADIESNPVKVVAEEPVSTFSIDVDTASYGFMRASLNQGTLPQTDAVRIEELINYFPYDYAVPDDRETPFEASVSVMPAPWNEATRLMHIGIKGYALGAEEKPRSNLVFLIDTSGSMNDPNKLPLLINSFKLLLDTLDGEDTVAIVTYAGGAGTALEPTKVKEKAKIFASLEQLRSGGSTAGAEGIRQAYMLAEQNLAEDGVNRVILATDGDFNVGITDQEELKSYIERKRETGVFLSVLGFGMGNYNDELMQTLAQNGNGNAAYIDSLSEARKVLVEEATSTLFTIAKDVKIQIEFNPSTVSEYRLIGYETRLLNREDFNNDKVDAGDIGAGHTLTAIYELTPVGSGAELIDVLRYQPQAETTADGSADEYGFLKIRFKLPDSDTSTLISRPVTRADESGAVSAAPQEARFATAVAGFGQLLRGGRYTGDYAYDDVIELAQGAKGEDPFGYRAEFVNLVRLAKSAAAMEPLRR
jgi:Ca-activated chloride channel family protein